MARSETKREAVQSAAIPGRRVCAVLRLLFTAALGAWALTAAVAAVPGEAGPVAQPVHVFAVVGLLAAAVVGTLFLRLLRENERLGEGLAVAETAVRRRDAEVQRLCGQLENLNAVLAVKNRQLLAVRCEAEFPNPPAVVRDSRDAACIDTSVGRESSRPEEISLLPLDVCSLLGRQRRSVAERMLARGRPRQ